MIAWIALVAAFAALIIALVTFRLLGKLTSLLKEIADEFVVFAKRSNWIE